MESAPSSTTIFIDVGTGPEPYTLPVDFCQPPPSQQIHVMQLATPSVMETDAAESGCKSQEESTVEPTPQQTASIAEENSTLLVIQPKTFKCPECPRFAAETDEKLQRHIKKIHRGVNPFSCYMCDYSTSNKTMFEEHVRIHQGIKPFKCSYCSHRSASKKNMKKHELIHRPDNPLRCQNCGFIAQNPSSLKSHEKKCSNNECNKCDFKSEDADEMKRHMRAHKGLKIYKCKMCSYKTKSSVNYKVHSKACKTKVKDVNIKFTCAVCQWQSKQDVKILLHLIHHPEQEVDESVVDVSVLRKHGIMV
ncbi:hypothetical protein JYU34_007931 [Plutella xylostella]|uniref:C2H2-type domain-containing protein n=1 Tax=Plutella xylostella TaxID=51655 RepID=A0ABQ7QNE0_PLUXY|nr:hypothetical protein JYU34_007931 [Plutella xylostella]